MKRYKFIATLLTLATVPVRSFAQLQTKVLQRKDKWFKTNSGEGRKHGHIKLKGVNSNILDVKVSGSDTGGGLAIFEQTSLSQGKGTPLHVHPLQDEVFYILDGSYRFIVGGEIFNLSIGDSIFLPRNVPHAWTQKSEKGKMTVILQPAGKLEIFFVTMAALDHEPTSEEIAKVFAQNDMKVVGPPLELD